MAGIHNLYHNCVLLDQWVCVFQYRSKVIVIPQQLLTQGMIGLRSSVLTSCGLNIIFAYIILETICKKSVKFNMRYDILADW